MQTRSTVLGKRGHQDSTPVPSVKACEQLQTPDRTPNPKRARTNGNVLDDDGNKENIPPLKVSPGSVDSSPRAARALRRNATETAVTPTRNRPAIRRNASLSSMPPTTPSVEILNLAISTPPPTPPTNLLPVHARARALLRATYNNAQHEIAGRVTERKAIVDFLAPFIENRPTDDAENASSMFISGSPGSGKTALVNAIIRQLSSENNAAVNVVFINCVALKGVDALWERMIEDLNAGIKRKPAAKKAKGREGVMSILNTLSSKCILILDELDHITPNAHCLASIFTLTDALSSQLRLIAIANTHTLTSSSTNGLVFGSNVRTIHFAPYTPNQLQEILQSRLAPLSDEDSSPESLAAAKKLLPAPTLMLLTKKIASLTGDVRSLFEVLRGAIDLGVAASKKSLSEENILSTPSIAVTPQHVLAALKAYTPASRTTQASGASSATSMTSSNSETVTKIRNLGLQARLVLLAILLASKRLEAGLPLLPSASPPRKSSASPMKRTTSLPNPSPVSPGVETSALHAYYTTVLSRTESGIFDAVSRSEFGDLLGILEGVGIATLSSSLGTSSVTSSPTKGRKGFSRSASFGAGLSRNGAGTVGEVRLAEGLWSDEVLRGLGVTGAIDADAREEEVRGIWEREKARLARDVKAMASASTNAHLNTFAGAFEDC
ncbi:Cell division control protein 6-like protein [Psilocybe cubensis]|uniref:Cell division control protein 6-like protein n=1 Tax=Psilocybe cubensis TaxID=181762 RepID=A0ACB8HAK5_PSICU|nr:Cell division control protein 6-like protein [Psilocybe cubensis]KAH9484956.1 Cell division control protein 6-like protein [Psilocybe cubensis]